MYLWGQWGKKGQFKVWNGYTIWKFMIILTQKMFIFVNQIKSVV